MEKRSAIRASAGKPEGKRLLGSPKRRWENNIKIYDKKIGRGRVTSGSE
jgi:hypothetical protein